jgi:hypothetical protein
MNDMTVGMENLPNVFINKILILPKGSGVEVKVQLAMYDHKTNRSWKNKINDLKTKIVFESRADRISMLNAGTMSLYDYEPSPQGYSTTEPFDCYVIGADSFSPVSTDGEYELNVELFTYTKPLRENLNVYAACFIDGFGFGIPMFDKFYGPMAAERIFVGGEFNTLSNYFYYPDTNEEYGGPVHQKPNGSFMEGSQHSDDAHKDVRLVTEENYKIQVQNFDVGFYYDSGLDAGLAVGGNGPIGPVSNDGPAADPGEDTTGVIVEDPNVPNSIPDRIY